MRKGLRGAFATDNCSLAVQACAVAIAFVGCNASADSCLPVVVAERGDRADSPSTKRLLPRITIETPGSFCLREDVHQAALTDPLRGARIFAPAEAMIRLRADDVSLDLGDRTISNAMPPGMAIIWFSKFARGSREGARLERASIRSGRLVSPGPSGVGIELTASRLYGKRSLEPATLPAGSNLRNFFADTRHQIEDLSIQAGLRAILIDGQNNVIRNNRIRVDGTTAIVAQGPGVIIENNLIEVKADLRMLSEHDRRREQKTPFAIRLVQADGAVIRNNEVRLIDGAGGKSLPAAVELVESRDVLIEANRLSGMQAAVRADAVSSYREIDNRLRVCPSGETRFLPPEERGEVLHARPPACRSTGGR